MTWMHVEKYLASDDRFVLPLGSTEQHAYISLATDSILAERVATEAAEPLGVPVFPVVAYGITPSRPAAEAWADRRAGVQLRWHDWWKAPEVRAVIDAIDPDASHASWMETYPWTRVTGVAPPAGRKNPVDLPDRDAVSLERFRAAAGDGSFGGDYVRSDEEMKRLWETAVRETRGRLTEGWGA